MVGASPALSPGKAWMKRYCIFLPEHRIETLQALSQQTGWLTSEWIRAMLDHGCQEEIVNELMPAMSGQMFLGLQKIT